MNSSGVAGFGLNERAWRWRNTRSRASAELRIAAHTLTNGARVLDLGVDVEGGLAAGQLLAELCMGGLGHVDFVPLPIDGESWPGVQVWTDHPAVACMASQYAGWAMTPEGYFAMGSGPLRARARVERELFEKLGYAEDAARGVLVLETRTLPTAEVAAWVAGRRDCRPTRSRSRWRPPPAWPAASRLWRAWWRPASTRWTRWASTSGGS